MSGFVEKVVRFRPNWPIGNWRPICQLSPIGTFWSNWRQFANWPGRKIGRLGRPIWRPILFVPPPPPSRHPGTSVGSTPSRPPAPPPPSHSYGNQGRPPMPSGNPVNRPPPPPPPGIPSQSHSSKSSIDSAVFAEIHNLPRPDLYRRPLTSAYPSESRNAPSRSAPKPPGH
ncbi:unnamed protein product [Oikopleura dioica]|uniref:Uncharacterized protein n=1 Tax=Oikopleura dioica TaxID=34765 RepID=E4XRI9_OIKDI|nr:unnamed protein product [Oikopleura dioica]